MDDNEKWNSTPTENPERMGSFMSAEKPKRKIGTFLKILLLAGLFPLGYLPSWFLHQRLVPPHASHGQETHPPELEPEQGKLSWKKGIDKGDLHLKIQDFQEALTAFQKIQIPKEGPRASVWYYRIGLCLEGMGQWEKALIAYRQAGAESPTQEGTLLSQIGQARMLIKLQRGGEAVAFMNPWMLTAADWPEWQEAIHEIWLLSLVEETLHACLEKKHPLERFPRPYPFPEFQDFLEKLPLEAEPPPLEAKAPDDILEMMKQDDEKAPRIVGKLVLHRQPIEAALARIAGDASLKIECTPSAKALLQDREVRLNLRNMPLLDLVDHLAYAWDLASSEENGVIRLLRTDEVKESVRKKKRQQVTRQALRYAVSTEETPRSLTWVHWKLAELEWETGHPEAIPELVEPLLKEISLWKTPALYLMGLRNLHDGKFAEARKTFFRVVDQDPGHALAGYAYFQLARLAWEERQGKIARTYLQRASAKSVGTPLHPTLMLNLALAHFLDDSPAACQALLVKHRPHLHKEPYRGAAVLLDSMATYQIAKDKGPARKESQDLLGALLEAPEDPFLGGMGIILRGQVCRDLGLYIEANQIYERAQAEMKGPLRSALHLGQAEVLIHLDFPDASRKLLKAIIERKDRPWSSLAKLQLASLELRESQYQDTLKLCHSLYHDEVLEVDSNLLFQIWGQAYLQLAEPAKAARCFAGLPPE